MKVKKIQRIWKEVSCYEKIEPSYSMYNIT